MRTIDCDAHTRDQPAFALRLRHRRPTVPGPAWGGAANLRLGDGVYWFWMRTPGIFRNC